ncbi:PID-CTERM protein-sorting domain-containing protein [Hymenobacter sp. PAMC 26628]|uniref:PID-CTERM protein-sorting domain-containing protein n=1 Tax=Hymenobacter sp. PAMC 26628 TaxID=1484118 RepID=UPI00077057D4|nr:hypothetical protein [Hymenobacter sp. PAMC 26628]AMJ65621.1 hypothetical protein AXW84_09400 [Hymenobacter sp. PAMC 26628]
MKNLFTVSFRTFAVGAVLALTAGASMQAQAQGSTGPTPTDPMDPPVTPPVPPPVPPPTAVPLDGGASLLLASGVAYGVRMLRRRRK